MHDGWRHQSDARVAMRAVVPGEERLAEDTGILETAETFRKVGAGRQRFDLGLGEGVVIARIGPAVGFRAPRSASSRAPGLEVMEEPRSAGKVNCPGSICGFSHVSLMSRWANTADSAGATIQPTTQRLKISSTTER